MSNLRITFQDYLSIEKSWNSKHFPFREFLKSKDALNMRIDNLPSRHSIGMMMDFCEVVLDPLRESWNGKLKILSGYRCNLLNQQVGGSITSDHRYQTGAAADIKPINVTSEMCRNNRANHFDLARLLVAIDLPYDQLILYPTFVHIGWRPKNNRGEILRPDPDNKGHFIPIENLKFGR